MADPLVNIAALPPLTAALLGAVLGLTLGSYLATVIIRWPRGETANHGRSRCDGCGRQLAWHQLVPLGSFIAARGTCGSCGGAINPVHPATEALCAIAGASLFGSGHPTLAPFAWLLIALAVCDGLHLWLPDRLVLPLALAGIVAEPLVPDASIGARLLGGLIGYALLALVAFVFRAATGRSGIGGGDPKLFGAIGLWTGWPYLPAVMLLACAIGFSDALLRTLRGGNVREMRLPLGTYLCCATLVLIVVWMFRAPQLNAIPLVTGS